MMQQPGRLTSSPPPAFRHPRQLSAHVAGQAQQQQQHKQQAGGPAAEPYDLLPQQYSAPSSPLGGKAGRQPRAGSALMEGWPGFSGSTGPVGAVRPSTALASLAGSRPHSSLPRSFADAAARAELRSSGGGRPSTTTASDLSGGGGGRMPSWTVASATPATAWRREGDDEGGGGEAQVLELPGDPCGRKSCWGADWDWESEVSELPPPLPTPLSIPETLDVISAIYMAKVCVRVCVCGRAARWRDGRIR